ncbi:MAG TPA: apolipoprotein N-acyltransferase [Myxococcota bacterium]|nr:apolipoprotein N-acyltransferase [Myxococcota bacterium]
MSARRAASLAAVAAALTVAAFPPVGAWPLALVMLAPLAFVLASATPLAAFRLTYAYTIAMGVAVARWLVHALANEYQTPLATAWGGTVGLVAVYALVPALAMAGFAWLRPRLHVLLAPLAFAALYAFSEWLRAAPLGLPWLLAAHALAPAPALLQSADVLGATGVSFLALAVSGGAGFAIAARSARPLLAPGLLWALALGYGALRSATLPAGEPLRAGVVQASIAQRDRWREGFALAHTEDHLALTRELLARAGPLDVVLWPETAIDDVLERDARLLAAVRRQVEASGVPIVTGAQRQIGGVSNSAFLVIPRAGLIESYEKQRLVPFAEYEPTWGRALRPVFAGIARRVPYRAGAEPRVFRRLAVPFAAPICFEITYPSLARRFTNGGARALLNLSNDAWFGRSGYAEMHLAHAIFRAIELRTPVVRAANTGVSALIDARGRTLARLEMGVRGGIHAELAANASPTLYARLGDAPALALLAAAALAPLAAARRP